MALFGRARRAILALLFGRAGEAFYLRQIADLTGLAVGSVQRELANLVRAGLVVRAAKGHQVYFRADERSPIYPELVGLVTKTAGVAGVIRDALAPFARKKMITVAFIYGSMAAGEQQPSSDVDLMIIGDIELKERGPGRAAGRGAGRPRGQSDDLPPRGLPAAPGGGGALPEPDHRPAEDHGGWRRG